jgi:hypothetical protein
VESEATEARRPGLGVPEQSQGVGHVDLESLPKVLGHSGFVEKGLVIGVDESGNRQDLIGPALESDERTWVPSAQTSRCVGVVVEEEVVNRMLLAAGTSDEPITDPRIHPIVVIAGHLSPHLLRQHGGLDGRMPHVTIVPEVLHSHQTGCVTIPRGVS